MSININKLAKTIGQMVADAVSKYSDNPANLELFMGDPDFVEEFYKHIDARAEAWAEGAKVLEFAGRPVWKTIDLGTHRTVVSLRQALLDEGNKIDPFGETNIKELKEYIDVSTSSFGKIELFLISVAELGFPRNAEWEEIRYRLRDFGFGECPREVGLQLRRQYIDQPVGEEVLVVTKPIQDNFGHYYLFRCYTNDYHCLGGECGAQFYSISGKCLLVVCRLAE